MKKVKHVITDSTGAKVWELYVTTVQLPIQPPSLEQPTSSRLPSQLSPSAEVCGAHC